jgi:hypothetical protein
VLVADGQRMVLAAGEQRLAKQTRWREKKIVGGGGLKALIPIVRAILN